MEVCGEQTIVVILEQLGKLSSIFFCAFCYKEDIYMGKIPKQLFNSGLTNIIMFLLKLKNLHSGMELAFKPVLEDFNPISQGSPGRVLPVLRLLLDSKCHLFTLS